MSKKRKRKLLFDITFVTIMLTSMFSGIWAGRKYFSSYELNTYMDTVTVTYKDISYTNDIDTKYTLVIEYNNDDGSKGIATIEVGNETFESYQIGDDVTLLRTDKVNNNGTIKDTYFEEN